MQWVAFIEISGFYAAVHRRTMNRVDLPLIVAANAVVKDGCPQAFQQGLRVGMPVRQARRQVPGALLAELGTADYEPAAHTWWNICSRYTPRVEPLAAHNAFVALPTAGRQPPSAELKALLREITAAMPAVLPRAGLAGNKLVARAAAQSATQFAASSALPAVEFDTDPAVVPGGSEAEFMAALPIAALWPARAEVRQSLMQLGLNKVADVAAVSALELQGQFGAEGMLLARWARGLDTDPVRAAWPSRTVSSRITFSGAVTAAVLPEAAAQGARELADKLRRQGEVCQTIRLELEAEGVAAGGAGLAKQKKLPKPQQRETALAAALFGLLQQILLQSGGSRRYTALTVAAHDLAPAVYRQLNLWGNEVHIAERRAEQLDRALAAVGARFPAGIAQIGWSIAPARCDRMHAFYHPQLVAAVGAPGREAPGREAPGAK